MKKVFIIEVVSKITNDRKVSAEGYTCLADAQRFICCRADHPEAVSPMKFESDPYQYLIHDITIV